MTTINDVKTKKPIEYNNGKVYKIQPINNADNDPVYIGSTTKKYLSQRMTKHRNSYSLWKNGKYHKFSVYDLFDKYGLDGCEIVLIENVNCNSKDELLQREKYHIQNCNCINKHLPLRTRNEYYKDNFNKYKEIKKQYQKDNANHIKEYQKQYKNDNKTKIMENNKLYYQSIKERNAKPYKCGCGSVFQLVYKTQHSKSLKHLAYIEQQQKMEN